MAAKLTADEIALCERFEEFLSALIKRTGIRNASVTAYSWFFSANVQDEHQSFWCDLGNNDGVAGCLESALAKFAEANPPEQTQEQRAATRAAELRAELAKLEGAA